MRNKFDEQLERLHVELIQMGALCEEAISAAAEALLKGDRETAESAVPADLAVAQDLRAISAARTLIPDLERSGDQAADIAELTRFVRLPDGSGMLHIADMARAVIALVTDSVDSFVRRDLTLARGVGAADDRVDELFERVQEELITFIAADPTAGEQGLDLLMVAKYLERIGDHATNIAEWVEYSITGTHPMGD